MEDDDAVTTLRDLHDAIDRLGLTDTEDATIIRRSHPPTIEGVLLSARLGLLCDRCGQVHPLRCGVVVEGHFDNGALRVEARYPRHGCGASSPVVTVAVPVDGDLAAGLVELRRMRTESIA